VVKNVVNQGGIFMPRRGENIHKRKDGRWEGRYIDYHQSDGQAHYKSIYARSYGEIKSKMMKIKAVPNTQRRLTSLVSMEQLSFMWLDDKRIQIKESTYARYYQVIHSHIVPYFKSTPASKVTNSVVNQFIKDKLQRGRIDKTGGLSGKSVSDMLTILLQIIQYGERKQYISNFDYDVNRQKREYNELAILTHYEQNQLIKYVKKNLDHKKLGILLALYTGIRLGELCALTWNDIDFATGTLHITKTLQRIKNTDPNSDRKTKVVINCPKSQKSIREIPLPTSLLHILQKFRRQGEIYVLSGTPKYVDTRVYQDNFKRYLKNAGIGNGHFHVLRHTFATRAIEQNFDYKTLSELLGHSTVRFTMERYVHSSSETKRANMERFAASF
jgi:integrase